ncbi:hypothetical protein M413DRAFT_442037 [Hebeloma cylindrosporum]|uniref:Uncharacterized protein n=1 Tax=Hebeloma cylindrosporum TaxID=76867 RepID=A0A0C2YWJ1_HEBCY|nr:hypothetical protein M413DRAFT_442037 [Hebeloma cylindrosporum h7]
MNEITATAGGVPEMGKYLRQIVDNSLEEGQFESAIAMLEQLRSPDHKPSVIHILHLLFISLHSTAHECRLDDTGADPTYDRATLLLQSPRKIIKQTKSALVLSPTAIISAQRLLFSFISTNSPSEFGAALPQYPEDSQRRVGCAGVQFEIEYVDSPIYNQAQALRSAKSCWEIMREGYVSKTMQTFGTPKARGKTKQGGLRSRSSGLAKDVSFEWGGEDGIEQEIKVVGEDSWFFLEWLVALFEKDAEKTESLGQKKHSPLLLRQLPPPPAASLTRWDASEPLRVVFYAFQQTDERRQRVGIRLLNLLIDTTQSSHLNLISFASAALAHLASSANTSANDASSPLSMSHPPDPLTNLFTHLPSTPAALSFKVAVCKKILQENDASTSGVHPSPIPGGNANGTSSSANLNGTNVPEPRRPRAQPRAIPLSRQTTAADISAAPPTNPASGSLASIQANTPNTTTTAPGPTPRPKLVLPNFSEVARLVQAQPSSSFSTTPPMRRNRGQSNRASPTPQTPWMIPAVLLRVKYELLLACAMISIQMADAASGFVDPRTPAESETEWSMAKKDGRLEALLRGVFDGQSDVDEGGGDKSFYAEIIRAVVGIPLSTLNA